MMLRRFNYTGRKKLPQNAVRIRVRENQTFDVSWDLEGHGMPASAGVFIEAFASGSPEVLRFPYGSVGSPDPSATNRQLGELADQRVAFTLKVVDRSEKVGRLLGVARNIKPIPAEGGDAEEDQSGQQPVLPVNPTDLGDQVWRINFGNNRPWLEVNNRIPNIMEIVREDRRFFGIAYPAVIRTILTRILVIDEFADPEGDTDDWRVQWLRWAIHWHPDRDRPVEGDRDDSLEQWLEWIEEVASNFCTRHRARERFVDPEGKGETS